MEEEEEEDFIPKAVEWLIKHLHNPYPSNVTKTKIAGSSSSRQKCVGDWFTNVRRRMGWSSILKKHFQGDRVATIDCAHRIFAEVAEPDGVGAEVLSDFMEMKKRLNEMFEGKLKASELAENIETIHDVPTKEKARSKRRRINESFSEIDFLSFNAPEISSITNTDRHKLLFDFDSSTTDTEVDGVRPRKRKR